MTRSIIVPAFAVISLLAVFSCKKDEEPDAVDETVTPSQITSEEQMKLYYVNYFAYNMMHTYYLWNEEISEGLNQWTLFADPIETVKSIRYKDSDGNDIDRWTQVTDDYAAFNSSVTGNTRSMGLGFNLYYLDESKTRICAVVTYTYPGSPADEAGLQRGDVILTIDGSEMTPDNYRTVLNSTIYGGGTSTFVLSGGRSIKVTARDLYLDPVVYHSVIEPGDGRKVGYLFYTDYTLISCPRLVEVFREFTYEGITDLVLDLRYNGGGYVKTSEVLASLIVPVAEVKGGSVFLREVYNSILTEAWGDDGHSSFSSSFEFSDGDEKYELDLTGANPGLSSLTVIMTGATASASEGTVCGLLPYMDITIVGEPSAGKYCGGIIVDGPTWYGWYEEEMDAGEYEEGVKYSDNWGIYVMISRYADRDGNTPCMPYGFTPDVSSFDNPTDGYAIGDPRETMLAKALGTADTKAESPRTFQMERVEGFSSRAGLSISPVQQLLP